MLGSIEVDVVDHRRERGRLTRTGRASYEDQTALGVRELLEDRRHAEVLQRGDTGRDQAERRRHASLIAEQIDAETSLLLKRVGEVEFPGAFKLLDLLIRQHRVHHLLDVERLAARVRGRDERAVGADDRRNARRYMEVSAVALDDQLKQLVDVDLIQRLLLDGLPRRHLRDISLRLGHGARPGLTVRRLIVDAHHFRHTKYSSLTQLRPSTLHDRALAAALSIFPRHWRYIATHLKTTNPDKPHPRNRTGPPNIISDDLHRTQVPSDLNAPQGSCPPSRFVTKPQLPTPVYLHGKVIIPAAGSN